MRLALAGLLLLAGCVAPVEDDLEMTRATKNNPAEMAPVDMEDGTLLAVAPIIARNGWWSGNNEIGYELEFQPSVNNRQTVLKLSEWGPPVTWTLALGVTHPDLEGIGGELNVRAVIEFGSGGVTQEVTIDWVEGNAIVLPANAINVIAEYVNPVTPPEGTRLRASLARGSLLNARPIFSQNFTGFPAPGFATPFPKIPNFAKSFTIIPNDAASLTRLGASITMDLFGTSDGFVPAGHVTGAQLLGADYPLGFPIVGPARYWNVVDSGAGPFTFTYRAVFFIGL